MLSELSQSQRCSTFKGMLYEVLTIQEYLHVQPLQSDRSGATNAIAHSCKSEPFHQNEVNSITSTKAHFLRV
jgi:hypothetical protein